MRTRRHFSAALSTLAIAAVLAFSAAPASSQVGISIYARGGVISPDDYFTTIYQNFLSATPIEWTSTSLGRAGAFGLGAELSFLEDALKVRGEIMYVPDGWMYVSHSIRYPQILFNPPYVETTYWDVPYDMTLTTLQLVLPVRLNLWGVEPYLSAGVGGKFHSFGEPTSPPDEDAIVPGDGFNWGGDVGVGLTIPIKGSWSADVQFRDAISTYWDETQNDFLFTAALFWRIR